MEQFSHDLTLALEETSKCSGVSRWSTRRRTRSTGNLPCAPQPTEDSSSPADAYNNLDGSVNPTFSDSDDRQEHKLSLKSRQANLFGNLESDSLNENFSPARPNTRRKRKFKRMAVEYETTPSTPGVGPSAIFPMVGAVKKRVFKHTSQENFKANLFFCGKRKRSHRDRYFEHSSSVPRQRDLFTPKNSYSEYRTRNRSFSKPCEKILPLNKTIVSKIEKISQETKNKISGFQFLCLQDRDVSQPTKDTNSLFKSHASSQQQQQQQQQQQVDGDKSTYKMSQKSGSFESTFTTPEAQKSVSTNDTVTDHLHKKSNKRIQMKLQLQFEDSTIMDCGLTNEFLSSSSMSSSSDSEAAETNESDREGDDELTDWPGNEAMVNFASKNDFKRAKPRPKTILLQKPDDVATQDDDDTLMSTDELSAVPLPPTTLNLSVKYAPAPSLNNVGVNTMSSLPIDITGGAMAGPLRNQIESEMSGETSNYILSAGNRVEVREIRAGCRRVRNERRGFTILTSANEEFSRFLQDARQERLTLPYTDAQEHEKLFHLAKLYSLIINIENGCAILTKTSNTTQSVKIDQTSITKRFLSDYKRRCYGGDYDDHESSGMAS